MELAIKIKDLKKSYKNTLALDGIDLEIKPGQFYGLLGPNGAGKTTTIGIITCLLYTSPSPRDATLSRMPSSA